MQRVGVAAYPLGDGGRRVHPYEGGAFLVLTLASGCGEDDLVVINDVWSTVNKHRTTPPL